MSGILTIHRGCLYCERKTKTLWVFFLVFLNLVKLLVFVVFKSVFHCDKNLVLR